MNVKLAAKCKNLFFYGQISQQTFVLMKRPFFFLFRRRFDQDEYIRLSRTSSKVILKTSSNRLDQDQYICLGLRLGRTSSRRLQNVLKTFSRRLQDIFKTFSRRIIRLNCLLRSRVFLGHTSEKCIATVENLQVW